MGTNKNLKIYLKQIHDTPPLSEEESNRLFRQIKKKGKKAEDARLKIIQNNLSLVVNLAKRYYYPSMNLEFLDFIEEGNIGLVKAVERFDVDKGFKFSTYASWWIEKHFQAAVLRSRSIVQIPEKTWRHLKKIEEATTDLLQQTGHSPDIKQISNEIDISIRELRDTLQSAMRMKDIRSLDYYIDADKTRTLEDVVTRDDASVDDILDNISRKQQLQQLLATLTDIEKEVLLMRFAITENRKHTYKEIGDKLSIAPSKAREIQERAIKKLRQQAEDLQV